MSDIFSNFKMTAIKANEGSKLLASGSVTISHAIEVKFVMMMGPKGPFASLPAQQGKKPDKDTGKIEWYPQVKILEKDMYAEFQKLAREAYEICLKNGGKTEKQGKPADKPSTSENPVDNFPF
jgi:hypothetical protein